MDRIEFHFDRRAIKRRIAISGTIVVLALAAIALFAGQSMYWMIALNLILAGCQGHSAVRDVLLLWNGKPAITIGDEGIRDAFSVNTLVPWSALRKIVATRMNKFGGSIFLIAERSQMSGNSGMFAIRAANLAIKALRRPESKQVGFLLTPSVILDASSEDIFKAIVTCDQAAGIPVEQVG